MKRISWMGFSYLAAAALATGLGTGVLGATTGSVPADGTSVGSSAPAAPADGSFKVAAEFCDWYAIFECAKRRSGIGGPGYVIHTNDYPNFRKGWYCKVLGPYDSSGEASAVANQYGGYAKRGC